MCARLCVFAAALAIGGAHQLSKTDQAAVQAYRSAIQSAEFTNRARGIESAFAAVAPLRDALMQVRDGKSVLESLSDADFQSVVRALPGTAIGREEIVFVEPDVDYFMKLAAARGDAADCAFFTALKATRPYSIWPVYVERQTDYSGCTRFGSMSLVDTFRAWSAFQQQFAGRYAAGAKKELDAVSRDVTMSTCACGDAASVEQELQQFLKDFPKSSISSTVVERLRAVRGGTSGIRMKCISGY